MESKRPKLKIIIATPFYEVKAYSPYIRCLINSMRVLEELRVEWDYYELSGDSYVDRAKNTLVHKFLEGHGTHLFMIDSDLSWGVEGFARIINAGIWGAEVVGGAYPNKNNWETFGCIPVERDGCLVGIEKPHLRLIEAEGIPGGFILYSRDAFERTRKNLNTYIDVTQDPPVTYLEAFRCNVEKHGGRIGEDIYFQQRYREMGGKVWLEPNIDFGHFGVKEWKGNYHEYLLRNRKGNIGLVDKIKEWVRGVKE